MRAARTCCCTLFCLGAAYALHVADRASTSTSRHGALGALPQIRYNGRNAHSAIASHISYLESVGPAASAGLLELATLGAHVRLDGVVCVQVVDAEIGCPRPCKLQATQRGRGGVSESRAKHSWDATRRCNELMPLNIYLRERMRLVVHLSFLHPCMTLKNKPFRHFRDASRTKPPHKT